MEVISGNDVPGAVLGLIDNAKERLVLVSAYFDPWDKLTTSIQNAVVRRVSATLLLRGGEDRKKHEEHAADLVRIGVQAKFLSRLHAKLYISETEAILTSMNLVRSSALDSWELAVCLSRDAERPAFLQVVEAYRSLWQQAEAEELRIGMVGNGKTSRTERSRHAAGAASGHCLRCGDRIALDVEKPFCKGCYAEWAKHKNRAYEERHCHTCGTKAATTMNKPLCRHCYETSRIGEVAGQGSSMLDWISNLLGGRRARK